MATVPALDLRQGEPANDNPCNLEAEQALLGCVLFDNDALYRIGIELRPEHFYEPFHLRMWKAFLREINAGRLVEPIFLMNLFRNDPGLEALGGLRYLADLVDRAPPAIYADDYAHVIHEAYNARELIGLADMIGRYVKRGVDDDAEPVSSAKIIDMVETAVFQMHQADPRLTFSSTTEGTGLMMTALKDRSTPMGVDLGIPSLSNVIGPLLPKELYIVAGRPSMGKSVVGCHVALRAAAPQWWIRDSDSAFDDLRVSLGLPAPRPVGVLEINGEMSVAQMTARHVSDLGFELYGGKFDKFEGFPSFEDIRNRNVSEPQLRMVEEASDVLNGMPIKMLKRSGLRVSQLRSLARRQAALWDRQGIPLGLLIVDHAGLLKAEGRVSSRYEAQTEIAMAMQQLCDDLDIPILCLVQLNREVDKREVRKPQLSDLRDAGAWEECADVVMFPFREQYYAQRTSAPKGGEMSEDWQEWDRARKSKKLEMIIGKNRSGRVRDADLWCEVSHNALRNNDPVSPRRNML